MIGPLAGLRVLDLSRLLPGPFLTQVLADLGALVTKVESPEGDGARALSPEAFDWIHRGKRVETLDLRAPGAASRVLAWARESDVLVDSFKPGVMEKLGLGDAALAAANPRLVRVSIVGYAPGAWRDEPGHDVNYLALAGALADQPGAILVADIGGALYGAVGVLAALLERERTGRGRRVEVALADVALALHGPTMASGSDALQGTLPCYRAYACQDAKRVALGALEPKFWARFVEAADAPDLADAQLDRDAVPRVEALFRTRDAAAWVALLRKAGVPATPVLDAAEALASFGRVGPGAPVRFE
jgi:crotonobetainyl-CoA:carnitine CoA-transferase CaiB-like acyl-CoA transferase